MGQEAGPSVSKQEAYLMTSQVSRKLISGVAHLKALPSLRVRFIPIMKSKFSKGVSEFKSFVHNLNEFKGTRRVLNTKFPFSQNVFQMNPFTLAGSKGLDEISASLSEAILGAWKICSRVCPSSRGSDTSGDLILRCSKCHPI